MRATWFRIGSQGETTSRASAGAYPPGDGRGTFCAHHGIPLARDPSLGRDVVIKVLSPELAAEVSVERFTREIRTAAGLQHPQIVTVLSAGNVDGLPFYTMPYIAGETLRGRTPCVAGNRRHWST